MIDEKKVEQALEWLDAQIEWGDKEIAKREEPVNKLKTISHVLLTEAKVK